MRLNYHERRSLLDLAVLQASVAPYSSRTEIQRTSAPTLPARAADPRAKRGVRIRSGAATRPQRRAQGRCYRRKSYYVERQMNPGLRVLLTAVLAASLWPACAKPGLRGQIYYGEQVSFRVGPTPEHWRSVDPGVEDETIASLAFRSDSTRATIGLTGRCNRDGDDVPLRALTQHLYIGFTQRELQKETLFQLERREALRTEMSAALDGVKKHMVFVVLKKDGCVYDFWRISDMATSATPAFDEFVQGFQALEP